MIHTPDGGPRNKDEKPEGVLQRRKKAGSSMHVIERLRRKHLKFSSYNDTTNSPELASQLQHRAADNLVSLHPLVDVHDVSYRVHDHIGLHGSPNDVIESLSNIIAGADH